MKTRLTLIALLCATVSAHACWVAVPLEKLVEQSPLIVVGEIVRIDAAKIPDGSAEYFSDTGYIRVFEVLRDTHPESTLKAASEVPLSMPAAKNKMRMSTDLRYPVGSKGIWLLHPQDKTFHIGHPNAHQPIEKADAIRTILKGKNKVAPKN